MAGLLGWCRVVGPPGAICSRGFRDKAIVASGEASHPVAVDRVQIRTGAQVDHLETAGIVGIVAADDPSSQAAIVCHRHASSAFTLGTSPLSKLRTAPLLASMEKATNVVPGHYGQRGAPAPLVATPVRVVGRGSATSILVTVLSSIRSSELFSPHSQTVPSGLVRPARIRPKSRAGPVYRRRRIPESGPCSPGCGPPPRARPRWPSDRGWKGFGGAPVPHPIRAAPRRHRSIACPRPGSGHGAQVLCGRRALPFDHIRPPVVGDRELHCPAIGAAVRVLDAHEIIAVVQCRIGVVDREDAPLAPGMGWSLRNH